MAMRGMWFFIGTRCHTGSVSLGHRINLEVGDSRGYPDHDPVRHADNGTVAAGYAPHMNAEMIGTWR
jgi:hypothetical protein